MDVPDKNQRHKNMSHIRCRDTEPEIQIRTELFKMGFRYRKNDKRLPGKPDLVFPKYRAVLFVNGCFWHNHAGCSYNHTPKSNADFWIKKKTRNRQRDKENYTKLLSDGWRIGILWECSVRGKSAKSKVFDKAGEITNWLQEDYDINLTDF